MGSKNLIAKEILPIMLNERGSRTWVEPFVGGGNMIDKVKGNRIGADINPYLIDALLAIRDSVSDLPKNNQEFTEDDYKALRKSDDDYKYKGYAGFAFSYGGNGLVDGEEMVSVNVIM
jgi:DNA adenine methylase